MSTTRQAAANDSGAPAGDAVREQPATARRRWAGVLARTLLAALGGGLFAASFAPREWWWLAPVAFACLGVTVLGSRFRAGMGYGFCFGLVFYLGQLYWIQHFLGGSFGPAPWLGLSTVLAVYVALAGGLMTVVARLPGAPVWLGVVFLLQEFARAWFPAGGFPWGKVAFSQPEGAYTSLASVGGAPLVGLGVLVTGFGLAQLVLRLWRVRDRGRPRGWLRAWRPWAGPVAAVLVPVLAGLAVWPTVGTAPQAGTRTVAVVQGDAPNIGLDLLGARGVLRQNHLEQSRELLAAVRAGAVPAPDLVVWPETATAWDGEDPALQALAHAFGVPMLVGARTELPDGTPQNVVLQIEPGRGVVDRYAKQQLVPFAEVIPYRAIASWFTPFAATTEDMKPGTTPGVFDVAGTTVGVAICYEVAYDYVLREATNAGARLLVLPTNNAWYGRSEMSYQQLAMARLRAVEHGRAVVVAATSGVSAIVSPDGDVVSQTQLYESASLVEEVPLRTETTLADRLGMGVEYALIALGLAALVLGLLRRRRIASRSG